MSLPHQPIRTTTHFFDEGRVAADQNRLAEQVEYVSRMEPNHPFFRQYLDLLQIHADSMAEVVMLSTELEVESEAGCSENLRAKRERAGALWRSSELTMPILADMCLSTSEGIELTEVALDASEALDAYAEMIDGRPAAIEFVPRPFAGSGMYAIIARHISNAVEEAGEYRL